MSFNALSNINYDHKVASAPGFIKERLVINLVNPYSPEEQEAIKNILKQIHTISYSHPEKAFHTMSPEDIEGLSKYLEVLIPLFDDANHCKNSIKQQIWEEIKSGKKGAIDSGGQPIDRIVFLYAGYSRSLHKGIDDIEFGEAINKEHDIDLYEDSVEGVDNGGGGNYIYIGKSDRFGEVRYSEDLIKNRPNAIVVIIAKRLRPKWSTMAHYLYHEAALEIGEEGINKIRAMTDEEIPAAFYTYDDGDDG